MLYGLLINIVAQINAQIVPVPLHEGPTFIEPLYVEEIKPSFETLEYSNIVIVDTKKFSVIAETSDIIPLVEE